VFHPQTARAGHFRGLRAVEESQRVANITPLADKGLWKSGGWRILGGAFAIGQLCSQEAAQNRIARQPLGPSLLGFLFAQFGNLAQKPRLNLRLHFDTVEFFLDFHGVTTQRGFSVDVLATGKSGFQANLRRNSIVTGL
jgi:hypothetical protein